MILENKKDTGRAIIYIISEFNFKIKGSNVGSASLAAICPAARCHMGSCDIIEQVGYSLLFLFFFCFPSYSLPVRFFATESKPSSALDVFEELEGYEEQSKAANVVGGRSQKAQEEPGARKSILVKDPRVSCSSLPLECFFCIFFFSSSLFRFAVLLGV